MVDCVSKEKRSKIMSSIKGKWTMPEKTMHNYLKANKIVHKTHPKINGNPDIILPKTNIAILIDGCFWHACPKCYRAPKSNVRYWISKIRANVARDKRKRAVLRRQGYKVIRVWEHEMKFPSKVLQKLLQL